MKYPNAIINKREHKELMNAAFAFYVQPSYVNELRLEGAITSWVVWFAMDNPGITPCCIWHSDFKL